MLLEHVNQLEAARRVRAAVPAFYKRGECLTRDMVGTASTTEMTDALVREIERTPAAGSTGGWTDGAPHV